MLVAHIQIHVKKESVPEFIKVTIENARSSIQEPGIVRFDLGQQQDDPTRFVLIEVYRSPDAKSLRIEPPRTTQSGAIRLSP